jgi:choline dehydrogenase-like flavoprotein
LIHGWVRDLSLGAPIAPLVADVCVLGAGPVGLTLARALAQKGYQIVVLEIGGSKARAPCDAAVFDRRTYLGASKGRAFGLGGTSTLWGGQLLPILPSDMRARAAVEAPEWPIPHAEIAPYFDRLQQWLGVRGTEFDLNSLQDRSHALRGLTYGEWAPRLSKWIGFGKRNLAIAWRSDLAQFPQLQLWLNAETRDWRFAGPPDSRAVGELSAYSPSGQLLRVQPKTVVIAAGALESARIVADLNSAAGHLGKGVEELNGRFLHDHLSLRLAQVQIVDKARFQQLFAPVFEGPTMRSLRLELLPDVLKATGLPSLYAHFVGEAGEQSGFAIARDFLRSVQQRDLGNAVHAVKRMPRALPDIATLMYERIVNQRLAYSANANLFLHIDFEQTPRRENRVYASKSLPAGRRELHIDWDLDSDIPKIAVGAQKLFEQFWQTNGLERVATLTFANLGSEPQRWTRNIYDIFHPAGTTRMAVDPAQGVVDANLMVHGTGNVHVVGSSVFPSTGAANPTFTAMVLALRLADFIDHLNRSA